MTPRELESLLQRFVDGRLDDEAIEELTVLVKEDPDVFETYCQYAELDAGLFHLSSGMVASIPSLDPGHEGISALAQEHQIRRTRRVTLIASVAAMIILLLTLSIIWLQKPETPPASITRGPGTSLMISHPENSGVIVSQSFLEIGSTLNLEKGTLELNLETGVRAILEAPALLTLTDKNSLQLTEGTIWCQVPNQAHGFVVETGSLTITDIGTEFAVVSYPEEKDEVHVLKGLVEVSLKNSSEKPLQLRTNQALTLNDDSTFTLKESDPSDFLTNLPEQTEHLHWSFDEGDAAIQRVSGRMGGKSGIQSHCTTRGGEEPFAAFSVVDGRFGNALSSFGRNGLVKTNWSGISANSPFTLCYWIKITPGQHSPYSLVSWGSHDVNTPSFFSSEIRKTAPGSVTAVTIGKSDYEGTTPIDDGEWHHISLHTRETLKDGQPPVACYLDGSPEPLRSSKKISHLLSSENHSKPENKSTLTLLDHPNIQARTGEEINLSLIRENGTTSVFLNGRNIGVSKQSPPPFDALTHLMVGANLDNSGKLEGFFTGTIDHLRLATFTGSLASRELLGDNHANINVVAEYDFNDHATPDGFRTIGQPAYENGKLVLDGDDALVLSPSPLTATDNFIMEVSCTMTGYPTNPRRFSFPISNGNGFNRGWGILYHHTWGGILMGLGPVGSATTDEDKIPVEIDELHIFSKTLRPREIQNLTRFNQIHRETSK